MRVWLTKIGVKRRDRPEGWVKPFGRHIKCKVKNKIYGVDPRDTYDLYYTWQLWLYEHLKMFRIEAMPVVDLEWERIEYNGKKYTQLEMIDMMLTRLEFALNPKKKYDDLDQTQWEYVHEVEKIWAAVAPAMWW